MGISLDLLAVQPVYVLTWKTISMTMNFTSIFLYKRQTNTSNEKVNFRDSVKRIEIEEFGF